MKRNPSSSRVTPRRKGGGGARPRPHKSQITEATSTKVSVVTTLEGLRQWALDGLTLNRHELDKLALALEANKGKVETARVLKEIYNERRQHYETVFRRSDPPQEKHEISVPHSVEDWLLQIARAKAEANR